MGDSNIKTYKVGSRKSQLALIQTNYVIRQLQDIYPSYQFNIVEINTLGDKILDKPLPKIGEKSLFTKELEEALENGSVDFVVHSLKDLPTTLPERKIIGAVLKREDPRDCVILSKKHKDLTLKSLPEGSVIGTSSLRRTAQLCRIYPHLKISNIRGNLNTRLKKLNESGVYDAIILAIAGVKRMNWDHEINEILDENNILYAVGQGALAVECQENNYEVLSLLRPLIHRETVLSILAERSFLRKLEGGCSAPVAVNSKLNKNMIVLTGLVSSLDGSKLMKETLKSELLNDKIIEDFIDFHADAGEPASKRMCKSASFCGISPGPVKNADMATVEQLGIDLANKLINKGALVIMEAARKEVTSTTDK
ncbi:hypothetical protein PGB90_003685 [Kerria lacca]